MDINFKDFNCFKYGQLKKENKILYDFFYKRFLDKRVHEKYKGHNIYGFKLHEPDFDTRAVNGSLMIESISPEGSQFWNNFYFNRMTKKQKTKLIDLIKKELIITSNYNLWI